LNAETANVVLSGEQPVISFLFTAPVNASLVCNQSGQMLTNGPA
jgi:hypothetical protein